jgi:hypothetical protein
MTHELRGVQEPPHELLTYFLAGSVVVALCLAVFVGYLR